MKKKQLVASILLAMRFTFLQLILAGIFSMSLYANNSHAQEILQKELSLSVDQTAISQVIKLVNKKTGVKFLYSADGIDGNRRVSFSLVGKTVGNLLEDVFHPLGIGYRLIDDKVLLYKINIPSVNSAIENPDIIIEGSVINEANEPLSGVSIAEKGTSNGTSTNEMGRFTMTVRSTAAVLVVSAVGYQIKELSVGNQLTLQIVLLLADNNMDSVVVTAFGIRRNQKALGYASQKVTGEQLSSVGNANIQNSLQGKAAGVQVRLSGGMPGRPAQINIRGSRSFTGSNEPLYVIDGLPVASGSRSIDFNPSDVESMDILKGPAAAILYGVRASNGVIVITTKSGKNASRKPTVTFESQFANDQVSYLPKLQKEYAQGNNGVFDQNGLFSYGPRINTLGTYTNLLGEQEQAASYNNVEDFFVSGHTFNNNLEIAQGGSFGNYSIGIGRTDQSGVIDKTGLQRTSLKFNGLMTPYKRFKIGLSMTYANINVDDFPDLAGNDNFIRALYEAPPSYNLKGKPFASASNPYQQILFRATQNNPYWVLENNFQNSETNRTFGSLFLEYHIANGLKANYRVGVDNYSTKTERYDELGTGSAGRTASPSAGQFVLNNISETQLNSNLFLSYDKSITPDFELKSVFGNELFDIRRSGSTSSSSNLVVGDWPSLSNGTTIVTSNNNSAQRVVGFYGNVNLGYKEMIYLSLSGRQDYASNLPSGNRSFFYPSASLSFLLTEAVPSLRNVFTFAKLRANYAEVGQLGQLFVNGVGYSAASTGFQFPYNGIAGFLPSNTSISSTLRPENTSSIELGTELRFLDNRISVDYTYFRSLSDGQIFGIPLAPSTGFTSQVNNAGKMLSRGHEVILRLTPINNSNFNWDFNVNFSKIKTTVEELPSGLNRIEISNASGAIRLVAEKGMDYTSFYGTVYQRDPKSGQIVYSSTNGRPLVDPVSRVLGTPNPDFEFNFINSIRYKSFSFGFQIDWRQGGLFFSQLQAESRTRGLSAETLDRDILQVMPGMKGNFVNGQLVVEGVNDIAINKTNPYWAAVNSIAEANLDDASFVRFRELNVGYELPLIWIQKVGMSGASIFLTGRNLFLRANTFVDPELNMTSTLSGAGTSNSVGIEWYQVPQTRSIGGGIRVKF